ncbi:uncharacterized protein GLRG_11112 [Colletotrichum graminicola M1.001]|uniref:Uncharacterized protein n=1 Tax=Colletotrichum graminicola (strain M1.001 / M2 / FGSC 10212) TaxID=645133 RepID=E3QYN0_COLGM|nr:uncharacterized protein GLRG_11112 [Colletotrichum graminicola M1.001]EFQ35968.1 hypothetical protein GLRG_11112 [Colletotrichum graminicola M1.001]
MALVFAAARFDYILKSDKGTEEGVDGEEDSTYAFYATKRRRASSAKQVKFNI